MTAWPDVTIIFRTCARPDYAPVAFRSLLDQDYQGNIRYLVGEENGRREQYGDDLVTLATEAGKGDQVTLIQNKEPLGETGNALMLVAQAKTDWVMLADDDDIAHPDRLRSLMETALSAPDAWQVYSDADCIDAFGAAVDALRSEWFAHGEDTLAHLVEFGSSASSCAGLSLYHKKVFDLAGRVPDDIMHLDVALAAAAMMGGTVLHYEKPLAQYRLHPGNHRFGVPARKSLRIPKHIALLRWLKLLAARASKDSDMAARADDLARMAADKLAALEPGA